MLFGNLNCSQPVGIEVQWTGVKNNFSLCFVMTLKNLAEPYWTSLPCNTKTSLHLICAKDNISDNHFSKRNVNNRYFCGSNKFSVDGYCFEFLWTSGISHVGCPREDFRMDIMILKHIFETIALEHRSLSMFMQKNKTVIALKFIKYLDKVSFAKSIVYLPDEGYIIWQSTKTVILIGIHTFKCSAGGNILHKYICDGIVDCLNDRSDEEYCVCNEITETKMCKAVKKIKHFMMCSSTHYMTKLGQCLKYENPNKIYQLFSFNHNVPKHIIKKTSKLISSDKSVPVINSKQTTFIKCILL